MSDSIFPKVKRSIENLIEDEEGNIPTHRLLAIGTIIVLMSNFLAIESFAKHSSHKSHSSHSSHVSGSHGSHNNHGSHESHVSHGSHTSHSNTASHSNSNYSAAGDYGTPKAPAASSITGIKVPTISSTADVVLPTVNADIAAPEATPVVGAVPALSIPLPTPQTDIPSAELETVPETPAVWTDKS